VNDFSARGLAKRPDQTFSDLFEERFELYMKYADLVIKCSSMTQEQVCARISKELGAALTPSGNL
jgi:shikimate kinase